MKKLSSILVVIILLSALVGEASQVVMHSITGKVTRVSDGDTIWVTDKIGLRSKIRMDRIDAPEKDQEWGSESTKYLSKLLYGRKVVVDYQKRDQYGRILGIVKLGERDVNLEMVKTGNAWHYSYFDHTPAYIEAEKQAKDTKLGLWSKPNPINPYEWRKMHCE